VNKDERIWVAGSLIGEPVDRWAGSVSLCLGVI
jgi:hypothetical protein